LWGVLQIELVAHYVRTRIFSLAELKCAQQFNLTEEASAGIETATKSGPAAPAHVPSAIELTPDTVESLKSQGYFNGRLRGGFIGVCLTKVGLKTGGGPVKGAGQRFILTWRPVCDTN